MRLDAERLREQAGRFAGLRLPGSVEERQAADMVADELAAAGFRVRREDTSTVGEPDDSPLVFGLAAGFTGLAIGLIDRLGLAAPGLYTLGAAFTGLIALSLLVRRVRTGRWGPPRLIAPSVIAEPADVVPAGARVVFVTHCDTRPPLGSHRLRWRWACLDLLWIAALWGPCFYYGAEEWLIRAGPSLLSSLGVLALLRSLDPWQHQPVPYPADNRTGLALLIELARGWPRGAPGRLDVGFLAVGRLPDTALRDRARSWTDKPTLVLNLEAPGVGRELLLAGSGEARALAETAARDLWLPWRRAGWTAAPLDHRVFAWAGLPAVSLVGELDAAQVEPASLAAAGQLATELALRWARLRGEAASQSVGSGETGRSTT
jgi:hypothetical protein